MGMRTDAAIEAWQKRAGLDPAIGAYADALRKLADAAFDLIKIIELEKSGIRDGDGHWHGSDVVGHTMHDMIDLCKRALELSSTARAGEGDDGRQAVIERRQLWRSEPFS